MKNIIFVGLSGPTYYDYGNKATKTNNDESSSPNPMLENVFGLAVFYDEIWFLCESLCPASLRGHQKVIYLDKEIEGMDISLKTEIKEILNNIYKNHSINEYDITTNNTKNYWERIEKLNFSFWSELNRAVDNHTHGLNIVGISINANSNSLSHLLLDLAIVQALKKSLSVNIDIELNSFTKNIYKALFPASYDPILDVHDDSQLSTYIIRAKISNSMNLHGPCVKTFDRIYESSFIKDFRGYIANQKFEEAELVYQDVIAEIDSSIKKNIQDTAKGKQPIPGLISIAMQGVTNIAGIDTALSIGKWYKNAAQQGSSIGAAAFLLDLD